VAEERGTALGGEVGYQVRLDDRTSARTRIRYATEGVLTARIQRDPGLSGVGAVVLDEFHERSLHADLALALLRDVRAALRPDLVLVVMSATLDAEPVRTFLGGAPLVEVPGRVFPVEVRHLPGPGPREPFAPAVASAVVRALAEPVPAGSPGHVLVFLPGVGDIERVTAALAGRPELRGLRVLPLHGRLDAAAQDAAISPADVRKVVLATNVAETSLTVPGVTAVIDSGLEKVLRSDPSRGIDRLELGRISRASADQRAGRAGRTAPGVAFRLWTEAEHRTLLPHSIPEIRRVDLAQTVLEVIAWGERDPERFGWFEAPPSGAIAGALMTLVDLGCVSGAGALTDVGRAVLELPLHPRLGRMVLQAAKAGCGAVGAALAATLSEPEFVSPTGPPLDLTARVSIVLGERGVARGADLWPGALARVRAAAAQIARDEALRSARAEVTTEAVAELLLYAFPDRVGRRRQTGGSDAVLANGQGVELDPRAGLGSAQWFIATALGRSQRTSGQARVPVVHEAVPLDPGALGVAGPWPVERTTELYFDLEREAVRERRQDRYGRLVLAEHVGPPSDLDAAGTLLAERAAADWRAAIAPSAAVLQLLARLRFVCEVAPDLGLPALDDARIAEIVSWRCVGLRSLAELRRVDWLGALRAELGASSGATTAPPCSPRRSKSCSACPTRHAWERGASRCCCTSWRPAGGQSR
jgi:ATP-dependent helicase HrpB